MACMTVLVGRLVLHKGKLLFAIGTTRALCLWIFVSRLHSLSDMHRLQLLSWELSPLLKLAQSLFQWPLSIVFLNTLRCCYSKCTEFGCVPVTACRSVAMVWLGT